MDSMLDNLNEEQKKPVTDTEGAVLVLAGAGSGKTRVLTTRIAYILEKGLASPWQILAITFTNKAAGEMRERVQTQIGECRDMWICTIHSMCVRILRANTQEAGIKPDFSIYSETERKNIIKKCLKELDFDDDKLLKTAKFHIGNAKMLGLDPDQYLKLHAHEDHIEACMKIYERYEDRLRENNALDFDDLLLYTLRLLRRNADVRGFYSSRFKYIMVDEFQDTNAVQYSIIKLLVKEGGNLFCVGDDDQSIYGWRGAQIENILRFDSDYPKAKVYKLERNYRSTGNILSLANTIIKNNGNRRGKTLWTEAGEGEKPSYFPAEDELGEALYAARTISDLVLHKGYKYSDFAVLMRINAITRPFEQEFTKYNIPYKVFGGLKFFERKEVKDVLAYMRLIANPYDSEALTRIINVPRRGIGGRTLEVMEDYASQNGLSLYDAVLDCDYLDVSQGTKKKLADFGLLIKNLVIESQSAPVNEFVRSLISGTHLREALEDENDIANIDEFTTSVDDYVRLNPDSTLSDYLSAITLYSDTDEMDESDYVTLATIHAVKGLEFRAVFIAGLEEGIMPSSRVDDGGKEVEEERRLMYVAITRARERLYLTRAKERNLYGRRDRSVPSRFVKELSKPLGINEVSYAGNRYAGSYSYGGVRSDSYTKETRRALYSSDNEFTGTNRSGSSYASPAKSFAFGASPQKTQAGKYRVGTKVRHSKFGNGTVVAVRNGGSVINVAFDGQGIKELSATIAPLTIIQY
ncbi:MAG: UvrD-helicase domain-containing protein [Clostridia bacterium]|nr:UvrD-helicase domain-containing protein [Clostridia bacterium]